MINKKGKNLAKLIICVMVILVSGKGTVYKNRATELNDRHYEVRADISVETIIEESSHKSYRSKLKIPFIRGMSNLVYENYINKKIRDEAIYFAKKVKAMKEEFEKEGQQNNIPSHEYVADCDYEVAFNKNGVLSIVITYYNYTGGAHGMYYLRSYNIDTDKGKELKLNDLFYKDFDYVKVITNKIQEEIYKDKTNYFENNLKPINENNEFYISNKGLIIYYQLYEIAPYAFGMPKFIIPYEWIGEGLRYKLYHMNLL